MIDFGGHRNKGNGWKSNNRDCKKVLSKRIVISQILLMCVILFWGIGWCNHLPNIPAEIVEESVYYGSPDIYSKKKSYEINTVEEWLAFSEDVNSGRDYSEYAVILTGDLDFEGVEQIIPVGNYNNPFRGSFCGEGHSISNLKILSSEKYVGLFGVIQNAVIQGVSLENCDIESKTAMGTGGIVGLADNCEIKECNYNGRVYGQDGSVGGIVGNNWSIICDCSVSGSVLGSTQNGAYTLQWQSNSYGTGGIAGDNGDIIYWCKNYANVADDTEEHESNTSRSGGISGCNNGTIATCVNYGDVTGGGITENNKKYATIRLCFNIGKVYSGISLGSYQDSTIECCVNLGRTSGRYAGDIVSFWGQESEENTVGEITRCLYIDSSKAGVARKKSFGNESLKLNSKIGIFGGKLIEQLNQYIENNEYYTAYTFLAEKELHRRMLITITIVLIVLIIILGENSIVFINSSLNRKKIYRNGISRYKDKEYWKTYKLLSRVSDYKDSNILIKKAITALMRGADEDEIIQLGDFLGTNLEWKKVKEDGDKIVFIATCAIFADSINTTAASVFWKESDLAIKLNTVYWEKWFGKELEDYLSIEISIPSIEEITDAFPLSEQRECKSIQKIDGVLTSAGNVYWWLRSEQKTSRMPFVTSEGLISERGKSVTANNIAVRPIIKVRMLYENDS